MAGLKAYLKQLEDWYGYNEKDNTDDIIIKLYNSQKVASYTMYMSDPWCMATVAAAAYASGNIPDIIPNTAYCPDAVNWFKSKGLWKSYKERPEVGYIVYYDWSGTRTKLSGHVGTVIKVNSTTMVVREGNYQDALKDRNIELNSPYILGYGTPKWPEDPVEQPVEGEKPASSVVLTGDTYTVKPGDNLFRIAVAAGVSVETLCKWNSIGNPDIIEVGQVVVVKEPVEEPAPVETFVVTADKSSTWVLRLQKELNAQVRAGLVEDGIAGPRTLGACITVGSGAKGNLTKLVQEKLGGIVVDGSYGPATVAAVMAYQVRHGINATGRVDHLTWRSFLGLL